MLRMADNKKPPRSAKVQPAPNPEPPPGSDPPAPEGPQREGKPVNVWVADDIYEALENFRESKAPYRPTKTDVVEVALQEYLKREGFYPPADSSAKD